MEHNKVIKDIVRGTVRINVKMSFLDRYYWLDNVTYHVAVWQTLPKKRKEIRNDSIASKEEIMAAKMEFWNKIKPVE